MSRASHVVLLMPLVISLHHLLTVSWENRLKSISKDRDLDPIRSSWKIAISISISMIVTALVIMHVLVKGSNSVS